MGTEGLTGCIKVAGSRVLTIEHLQNWLDPGRGVCVCRQQQRNSVHL